MLEPCDGKLSSTVLRGLGVGNNPRLPGVNHFMKTGRALEKLVAYLERHFADSDTVIVESPKRLPDKTTGKLREHDVVLTVTSAHHKILVAVECRDRSRPVGVPQIEAFAKKCSETLIDKGVIVSPCGFTLTAMPKSKALNIRCLSLDHVKSLPWMFQDFKYHQFQTSYKHFNFTIIPEENFLNNPKLFDIKDENGESISIEDLRNVVFNAIKEQEKDPHKIQIGELTEKLRFIVPNLTVIDKDTGISKKVKYIDAIAISETRVTEAPFVLQEYKDAASSTSIAELAVAKVDFGFMKGKIVINNKLETGGEVVFIPDTEK
jgi:hypothetical protein